MHTAYFVNIMVIVCLLLTGRLFDRLAVSLIFTVPKYSFSEILGSQYSEDKISFYQGALLFIVHLLIHISF